MGKGNPHEIAVLQSAQDDGKMLDPLIDPAIAIPNLEGATPSFLRAAREPHFKTSDPQPETLRKSISDDTKVSGVASDNWIVDGVD
jgi:hypothetical protein